MDGISVSSLFYMIIENTSPVLIALEIKQTFSQAFRQTQ